MTNTESLWSVTVSSAVQVTRTRARLVRGWVTIQLNAPVVGPVLAAADAITLHVDPPSRVISMRTVVRAPRLWAHVIVRVVPTNHEFAPFGDVTTTAGGPTLKLPPPPPPSSFAVHTTRTRAEPVSGGPVTQSNEPVVVAFTVSPRTIQLAPSSALASTRTEVPAPRL